MAAVGTNSWRVRWPLYVGMGVAGTAAVVASASTLADLAQTAGWSDWTPWLLPAAVDIGGSAGGWCWLRPGIPDRARRFGRVVALSGAGASLVGNASGHLMASGYLVAGPVLVVVVGATPAIVLVCLAHLAALLSDPDYEANSVPPEPTSSDLPRENQVVDASEERVVDPPEEVRAGHAENVADPRDAGEAEELAIGAQEAPTRQAVLDLVTAGPQSVADLARATGRSRSTITGHLTALTRLGMIGRDQDKRFRARPHLIVPLGDEEEQK